LKYSDLLLASLKDCISEILSDCGLSSMGMSPAPGCFDLEATVRKARWAEKGKR
jgi:hypothetical protein